MLEGSDTGKWILEGGEPEDGDAGRSSLFKEMESVVVNDGLA